MTKLTAKQQCFCEEYLIDLNATQAAIRAGYSEATANRIASENLSKLDIQECIAELMAERSEKTKLNAEYVLNRLHEIESFNSDSMYREDGNLKGVSEWPENAGRIISGIEISRTVLRGDDDDGGEIVTKKIKVESRTKALELMGKHVNIKAFDTTVTHTGVISLKEMTNDQLDAEIDSLSGEE